MMKHPKTFSAVAMIAWILAGPAARPALADTIDPVSFFVDVVNDGGVTFCTNTLPCAGSGPSSATEALVVPDTYDGGAGSPYSGSAIATVSGSPDPTLTVSAAASADMLEPAGPVFSKFTFSGSASITYYFELTQTAGPGFTGSVPVLLNGSSGLASQLLSAEDTTSSSVSMQVSTADNSTMLYSLPSANNGGFSQSLDILPNVEYLVSMQASAAAQVLASEDTNPMLSASAFIDPTFTISPDFADDFQLTFSSSIGNGVAAGAAPEPGSMTLFGIGLAGLAYRIRRNRRRR